MNINGIFNAFGKLSEINIKIDEIKGLKHQNARLKKQCGSCNLWMTQQCPYETKTNKVSMGQSICSKFKMDEWTNELILKNKSKVDSLENEIKSI